MQLPANMASLHTSPQVDFRDASSFDLLKSHVADGYLVESASFAPEKGK